MLQRSVVESVGQSVLDRCRKVRCREVFREVFHRSIGESVVEHCWRKGLQSYHPFNLTQVPLNQKAYGFWRKQGFQCACDTFTPGCLMTKAQLGRGVRDIYGRKAVIGMGHVKV